MSLLLSQEESPNNLPNLRNIQYATNHSLNSQLLNSQNYFMNLKEQIKQSKQDEEHLVSYKIC